MMFTTALLAVPLILFLFILVSIKCEAFVLNNKKVSWPSLSRTSKLKCLGVTESFTATSCLMTSDGWSGFSYIDDDEDLSGVDISFADENDPQEVKAQVGAQLKAPEIEMDVDPILVPVGSALPLTEENVLGVLSACRQEIGTMFGYSAENRGVGITGGVDYVGLDGPTVILSLKGRFWHQRTTVLDRVGAYLMGRIPELIDVTVEDPYQLTDEANNAAE